LRWWGRRRKYKTYKRLLRLATYINPSNDMDAHAIPRRRASGKSNISLFSLITTYFTHSQDLSNVKEISVKEILLRISRVKIT